MTDVIENTNEKTNLADPKLREMIDPILAANQELPGATMVVLNEIQRTVGYVSPEIQQYVAYRLGIPVSVVHGVVSFYSFFTTQPRGKHTVKFCLGTACYVGGTPQIIEKAKQITGIEPGKTTANGNLTLEVCRCVGACSQAPVVVIDDVIQGRVRPNRFPQLIRSIQEEGKA